MSKTRHSARWLCSLLIFALVLAFGAIARLQSSGNAATAVPQTEQRAIVITIDDLPGAEPGTDHAASNLEYLQKINREIPAALRAHHVPGIAFANEWKLQIDGQRDARAALLQSWLDAGMTLGNHTYSHPDFTKTQLAQYEDDVIRGEVVTRALMAATGKKEEWFRHPFLSTGPTPEIKAAFEAFLKQRGYRVAPVTIDPSDYMFNDILGEARKNHATELEAKTKKEFFEYANTIFSFEEKASQDLFGRKIPQILLLHDSELNAECLDALLTQIEKRGYKFVSLDEALADPAYATPDLYAGPLGISWLTRWRLAFGKPLDDQASPDPPKWISDKFDQTRSSRSQQTVH